MIHANIQKSNTIQLTSWIPKFSLELTSRYDKLNCLAYFSASSCDTSLSVVGSASILLPTEQKYDS